MAITINWGTRVINVPQADLTFISTGLYELDLDDFRLVLKDLEDSEEGMNFPYTHNHNAPVTVGGVTLARVVEIVNGYTITFENGTYAVRLVGANTNVSDVANINSVSIRSNNSAGLIQVAGGGGGASASDIWSFGSRTLTANPGPTAAQIRQEIDSNSTQLAAIVAYVDELESRLTAVRAALLDNLDATVSSRASASALTTLSGLVDDLETRLTAVRAGLLDNLSRLDVNVSTRAVAGDSMALTSGAVDAIWNKLIDGGYSALQAQRLLMSVLLSKVSGGGTGTEVFRDVADTKNRVTVTVDSNGNRSQVVLDAA